MSERATCIVCGEGRATPFFRIEHSPVSCNYLCSSRSAALNEPTAAISLGFCPDCGHVFNIEYDSAQSKYWPGYENSLRGSERFREYDDALVDALLERYHLRGRVIIEIGCGRGEFLRALCERGANSGIGFDPSYSSEEEETNWMPGVVIRSEVYKGEDKDLSAEFICSRHTLEHVGDPRDFLSNIRNTTTRVGIPVFFEVPNGLYTLRDGGIWDIIYEHCSYFTPSSLARVFRESGYEPVEVAETFAGQFLTIHAVTDASKAETATAATPDLERLVGSFAKTYQSRLKDWAFRLMKLESEGRRIVVWGAGSKATTFLNLLRPATVDYVVDVNPRKHGKYVIGTGQRIVPPEFLREYVTDEIICMNPNYVDEIACQVRRLGVHANLVSA
jgi:cyclopropane fatty-acyl-phospholipid synthase-like methyltransferase